MSIVLSGGKPIVTAGKVVSSGGGVHTLSALVCWLDAQMEQGYADTNSLGVLRDFSNNGASFVQATGTAQPTFRTNIINGKPVFRFDGTTDQMTCSNLTLLKNVPGFTFFVVYKKNSTSGTQYILSLQGGTSGQTRFNYVANINSTFLLQPSVARIDGETAASLPLLQNDTSSHVVAVKVDYVNNIFKLFADNRLMLSTTLTTSGGNSSNTNSFAITLGNITGGSSWFNGDLGTFALSATAETDNKVFEVMGNLKSRWGI